MRGRQPALHALSHSHQTAVKIWSGITSVELPFLTPFSANFLPPVDPVPRRCLITTVSCGVHFSPLQSGSTGLWDPTNPTRTRILPPSPWLWEVGAHGCHSCLQPLFQIAVGLRSVLWGWVQGPANGLASNRGPPLIFSGHIRYFFSLRTFTTQLQEDYGLPRGERHSVSIHLNGGLCRITNAKFSKYNESDL